MAPSTFPTARPDTPDWSKQIEELHCPLCDYNLRGLVEPRCPECGYAFDWADLTDPARKKHPYLFEHHPNRNIWSFRRTVIGQLLPRRFWRGVRPEMPSNRRRLFLYWGMTVGCCLLWLVLPILFSAIDHPIQVEQSRQSSRSFFARNRGARQSVIQQYGSVEAYLDQMQPGPLNRRFWRYFLNARTNQFLSLPQDWRFTAATLLLIWPWATLLVMQVFRYSMRQARILPIHLQRVVLYSFDAILLLLLAGTVIHATQTIRLILYGGAWAVVDRWYEPLIAATLIVPLILYRLLTGFWLYLKLKHAIETVLLTQFILVLCVLATAARWMWLTNTLTNQWLGLFPRN